MMLRALFVICLALLLLLRPGSHPVHAGADYGAQTSERLRNVLEGQGLQTFPHRAPYEESLRTQAVWFQPPGCEAQAVAMPFHMTMNARAYRAMNEVQDWPYTIAYMDRSAATLTRVTMLFDALSGSLRAALGGAEVASLRNAVFIAAPAGCEAALTTALSDVWRAPE